MFLSKYIKYKNSNIVFRLAFFDFIAACIAWIFTINTKLSGELFNTNFFFNPKIIANTILVGVFWLFFLSFFGLYVNIFRKSRIKEILKLSTITFFGVTILFFLLLVDNYDTYNSNNTKLFILYFFYQLIITAFFKTIIITHLKRLIHKKKIYFNTLIIGNESNIVEVYREIENSFEALGFKLIAYLNHEPPQKAISDFKIKYLGGIDNLAKVIKRCHIEHVIIATSSEQQIYTNKILNILENQSVKISILPQVYQYLIGSVKVSHVFDIPLIEINQDLLPVWQSIIKRCVDVTISLLVLTVGFPFLATIALLTKYSSPGPIFYRQERIGKGGLPFKIIKFRSMVVNSELQGPALSSEEDPRITKWGKLMRKTRIDEFPQFYNVLIGDMSLVGPRPERQYYIDLIIQRAPHYSHLHKVRPGITSLGQVKFGYAENVEQMIKRLKYDILYIENMSIAMDLRIVFYTIVIMIEGRGK